MSVTDGESETAEDEGHRALSLLDGVKNAELITQIAGGVNTTSDARRMIAVFDNGIAFIAHGKRWSPVVKTVLSDVRKAGYTVTDIHEVEVRFLIDVYQRFKGKSEAQATITNEIERQRALRSMIEAAVRMEASDIQIRIMSQYAEFRIRVFGRMQDLDSRDPEEGKALIRAAFAVGSDLGNSTSELSFQQGALTPRSGLLPPGVEMIRMQYSPTSEGRGALAMRLKYYGKSDEIEIDSLGYGPAHIRDIATMRRRTNGLYVFAGKVSSGKSTTLQRVLNKMFSDKRREISTYTIEEPVELDLRGAIQVPVKINADGTDGFVEGMKAALRSDPNVIVLGEIRSQQTAYLAIQAVMTGHALWSTIHAGSALGILDRLTDLGVEKWKIEDPTIVRGLVYQRLIGRICRHCRIDYRHGIETGRIDAELGNSLSEILQKPLEELYLRGDGCRHCRHGLAGRTVVAETIQTTPYMLELYAAEKRAEMRKHWLRPESEGGMGGSPVIHHALTKVGAGISDINEVEEEVDLVELYKRDYNQLFERLRNDVARLEKTGR